LSVREDDPNGSEYLSDSNATISMRAGLTYTIDNKDATKEATPATIIVARVNFSPVPPEIPPAMPARL
jgi:hypothetical protein